MRGRGDLEVETGEAKQKKTTHLSLYGTQQQTRT